MSLKTTWGRPDILFTSPETSIGSNAAISGVSLAAQGLLRLLFLVLTARLLGPHQYGQFGTTLAICSIAIILGPSSMGAAFSKFVGGRSQGSQLQLRRKMAHQVTLRTLQSTGFLALTAAVVTSALASPELAVPAALLTVGLSGQAFGRGVHMALRMVSRDAILQIAAGSFSLLALYTISAARITTASAILILSSGLLLYFAASYPRGVPLWGDHQNLSPELDRYIAIAAVGSVASAGLIQLCVVAGNVRLPLGETGQLSAAVSLATPIGLVASAIGLVALPRMAAQANQGDFAQLARLRVLLTCALTTFGSLAVAVMVFAGDEIARFALGPEFFGGGELLAPLALGVVCLSISSASATAMSSTVNRSLAIVSGSAWGGLVVSAGAWLVLPGRVAWIAAGYVMGSWVAATLIISAADRHVGGRTWPGWLASSAGLLLVAFGIHLADGRTIALVAGGSLILGGLCLQALELRRLHHPTPEHQFGHP